MSVDRPAEYLVGLVRELCKLPAETEWVEFKENNKDPQEIGEYISALSNSAALNRKANGYLIWGVKDDTHDIVGTEVVPSEIRNGNEPLETWLLKLLEPKIHFRFFSVAVDGRSVVILEIPRAFRHPVRFSGKEYIRVGEAKKPLAALPEREAKLWRILDETPFESLVARQRQSSEDVLRMLDYPSYFELLELPLPGSPEAILDALAQDHLIQPCEAGGWDIQNLGALLFAKKLRDFPSLERKAIRVIQYKGAGRTETLKEQMGGKGYASAFQGLVDYVNGILPSNEVISKALRKVVPMFPELAVRELLANALIHQDFSVTGAGPMVEIFSDRIEITNPGKPLVETQRFLDTPPRSRNEALASLMRRFRICEERGGGIDKVVFEVEQYQLPAPLFEVPDGFTRSVLFAHKDFSDMDRADRVRACYLHACLRYVMRQSVTNSTIRERFGISEQNSAIASRLLNEAVEEGLIVVKDPEAGTRARSYLPYWAAPGAKGATPFA